MKTTIFVAFSVLLFTAISFSQEPKPARNLDWLTKHPVIVQMRDLQNTERARYGIAALKMNPDLCLIAQRHAVWMSETGWFQHGSHGHAEIIHQSVRTPEEAVQGWIYSPSHFGIMVGGYSEVGCGYMKNPINGQTYWVSVFR